MDENYIKETLVKNTKVGENLWYTLKDDEGIIRPMAGLWQSDGYGKEAAEERAAKVKSTVVLVEIKEA